MVKDAFRVSLVQMLDGAGYSYDILAQRFEIGIALFGTHVIPMLNNLFG